MRNETDATYHRCMALAVMLGNRLKNKDWKTAGKIAEQLLKKIHEWKGEWKKGVSPFPGPVRMARGLLLPGEKRTE